MRMTRNHVTSYGVRGFKSLSLRHAVEFRKAEHAAWLS